jgi:hypothetical protein
MEMASTVCEPIERPTPPCWWRQSYSYALIAVAGTHLALAPLLAKWADWSRDGELAVGVMLGQGFILGLWATLGGLRVIARWGIVLSLCVVGTASIVAVIVGDQEDFVEFVLFAVLFALLFVTGVAVSLLPLRGLAGWRVDFAPAYYAHLPLRRGQVGLMDYAGYTCAVAGPLVVVRLMLQLTSEDRVFSR